jgi:hypothetical protein
MRQVSREPLVVKVMLLWQTMVLMSWAKSVLMLVEVLGPSRLSSPRVLVETPCFYS